MVGDNIVWGTIVLILGLFGAEQSTAAILE